MGRKRFKYFEPTVLPKGYTKPGNVRAFDFESREKKKEKGADTIARAKKRRKETSSFTADDNDHFIGVSSTSAAITITLPPTSKVHDGQFFIVKDEGGSSNTNAITIAGDGADTIDGQASVIINSARGAINLYSNGGTNWCVY